jgi:glycolate oxidase
MKEIIKEGLIEIVGKENYTDQIIDLVSYSYDASEYRSRPECAVWAESTDQISWILRLADKNRTPIVPRGAGTGLAGLSVPVKGGILLDLSRMDQIIRVSIPDRLSVVQPGVVYADLQEALASDGFFYPPDPASGKVCTLGGNVATNAGGLRGAKYGTTRDYVLALEVVLADGEVMRIGSQTMKCSSGYDLTRLFVGSEGTLGVVTEITLKISPKPTEVATAVAAFDRLEGAGEAVTLIMQSGVTPSVLELIDANTISVVRKHTDLQLPEVEAILLAEIDGNTQVGVKYQMEGLIAMFNRCHARNIETAHSAADAEHLWLARKSLGGLVGSVSKNLASEDVTVPMGRIAEFLRKVEVISKKHNLLILNFGHAGAGNFHPNILYDRSDSDQVNRLDQVLLELHELACKLGGTLTGEHGIGITKARFMTIEHDPAAMRVMRALKKTLDPNNILNPGKMDLDK